MNRNLPGHMKNSLVFNEDFNSKEKEFNLLENEINDIELQLNIDTATWGLKIYEKELGIPTDLYKSYEERRSIIKSKLRSFGKIDCKIIKNIVEAFTRSNAEVIFYKKINIYASLENAISLNLKDLFNIIEDIKPAPLDYTFCLDFRTKDDSSYVASYCIGGEEITVYPWTPESIQSKCNVNIAVGNAQGTEEITIYPKKEG